MSKPNPFGTEEFVRFRQVFGLHRFKLKKYLVDGTVKSVWFYRFRLVFGLHSFTIYRTIIYSAKLGLGLWCLMQLSKFVQVYHG